MSVLDIYHRWLSLNDKRVERWPLMASPWPTVAITAAYVAAAYLLPKALRGMPALPVKYPLLAYNLLVMAINAHIAYELLANTINTGYDWICQAVDYGKNEASMRVAAAVWWFYFSKAIQMLDSAFFLLGGRHDQLTFLHVYHHASMFSIWWIAANFVPGGSSVLPAAANSVLHIIMKGFSAATALGCKRHVRWKGVLTVLSLLQFCFNLTCAAYVISYGGALCDYPIWISVAQAVYMVSLIALVGKAYLRSYYLRKSVENGRKKEE